MTDKLVLSDYSQKVSDGRRGGVPGGGPSNDFRQSILRRFHVNNCEIFSSTFSIYPHSKDRFLILLWPIQPEPRLHRACPN